MGDGEVSKVNRPLFIEAAVESIGGVLAADAEGVDRIELCGSLHDGGLTPSAGLIERALACVTVPIHVFVRPRTGNFVYDRHDVAVMLSDIEYAKTVGAVGVVFGVLTADGRIDRELMAELIAAAKPMAVGFHRAFDQVADQSAALETLIDLSVAVVLTSGGAELALDGSAKLRQLVDQARGRIDILAGGGITPSNVAELLERSGVRHVHGKAFVGVRAAAAQRR